MMDSHGFTIAEGKRFAWDANAPEEKPLPITLLGVEGERNWQLVQCDESQRDWIDKARIRRVWDGKARYSIWLLRDDRTLPVCEIQLVFDTIARTWREASARNFRVDHWRPPVAWVNNPDWQPVDEASSDYYDVAIRNSLAVLNFENQTPIHKGQ